MPERFVTPIPNALRALVALAFVLAALLALPAAASAATRYVAPGAADAGNCAAAPCGSFGYAFQQSAPGDVVHVSSGSYAKQYIPTVAGRAAATPVTFAPAAGASVQIGGLDVTGGGVVVRDIVTGDLDITDAQNVLVVNGRGVSIWMNNVRDVTVRGGSFGGRADKQPVMVGATPESQRVTFDGVDFHDALATKPETHTECLMANNVQGLTIKNSIFRNCAYFGVLISSCCGGTLPPRDVLIESNVFEHTYQQNGNPAPCAMMIGGVRIENLTFRNNTFETPLCFSNTIHANTKMVGNLGALGSCSGGVTYAYNLWSSRTCSATDRQASGLMSQFVNPGGHDWHLKDNAAAIDKASPSDAPATDRDGKGRRGVADAGAHEWGVADPTSAPPTPGQPQSGGAGSNLLRRVQLNRKTICHRRTPTCKVTTAKLKVAAERKGRIIVRIRRAGGKQKLVRTLRVPLRKRARIVKIDGRRLRPGHYRVTATVVSRGGLRDRSRVLLLTVR